MLLRVLPPLMILLSGVLLVWRSGALADRGWGAKLAWGYLAGAAWMALALLVMSHVLRLPIRPVMVWVVALTPVAIPGGWGRQIPARVGPRPGLRTRAWLLPVLAITAIVSVAVFLDALGKPLIAGDGRATWAAMARYMRAEGSVTPRAIREGRWFVHHPDYPPALPTLQAATLEAFSLPADDRGIRPLYAAFLPALVGVTLDLAARAAGLRWACLGVAFLPMLGAVSFDAAGGAASGYSDLPLACFFGAGFLLLLEGRRTRADGLIAGLLLGAAAATKAEGIPLAALALGASLWLSFRPPRRREHQQVRRSPRWSAWRRAAALVVIAVVLVLSRRVLIENRLRDTYESQVGLQAARQGLRENLPIAIPTMLAGLGDQAKWGGLWTFAVVVGVAGLSCLQKRRLRVLAVATATSLAIPLAGYVFAPRPTLWLVSTTWSRFLLQLLVPIFVLLAAALRASLRAPARWRRPRGLQVVVALVVGALAVAAAMSKGAPSLFPAPVACPSVPFEALSEDPAGRGELLAPGDGAMIRGPLKVTGWVGGAPERSVILDIRIDNRCLPCESFQASPGAVTSAADPERLEFSAVYAFHAVDPGPHELQVRALTPTGTVVGLRSRFTWLPD